MSGADRWAVSAGAVKDGDKRQWHAAVLATHVVLPAPRTILHQSHVRDVHHGWPVHRLALKHRVLVVYGGFGEAFVRTVKQRLVIAARAVQQPTENVPVTEETVWENVPLLLSLLVHPFNCPSNIIPAVISSIAHPTSFLQSSLQLPIQHYSCSHLFNCPSNINLAVISSIAHPTLFLQSSLQLPIQHHSCSHLFNCPSNIILAVISSIAHPTFSQSSIKFPVQQRFCWCTETKLSRPARHWWRKSLWRSKFRSRLGSGGPQGSYQLVLAFFWYIFPF